MPFRCLRGDDELLSFQLTSETWDIVKEENKRLKNLKLPCCGSDVVLKRSKSDTPFFAHYSQGNCSTQSESAQHLLAKLEIAKAVEAAGWTVTTEKRGITPKGDAWVADVYATQGKAAVAIEVQLANQSEEETAFRQRRYNHSKVRGLWLFRQNVSFDSKNIPAFKLIYDKEKNLFTVQVRTGSYCQQVVELRKFIMGALNRALKFAPTINAKLPLEIYGDEVLCLPCRRLTNVVTHFKVRADWAFKDFGNWSFYLDDFKDTDLLFETIPELSDLTLHKIGQIKNTTSKSICSTCFYCNNFVQVYFDSERRKILQTMILVNDLLLAEAPEAAAGVNYWWFDSLMTLL